MSIAQLYARCDDTPHALKLPGTSPLLLPRPTAVVLFSAPCTTM